MSTSMQKLSPYFDEFSNEIKQAKDRQGKTLASLSETSGVPYTAVSRICAGTQVEPRLFNAAALCDDLGLSMDKLFGLTPTGDIDIAERRIHELEVENAALKATVAANRERIKSECRTTRMMAGVCFLLAMSLVLYLFIDSQIKHAGLIRNGTLSLEAWLFIVLIVLSMAFAAIAFVRSLNVNRLEEIREKVERK